MGLCSRFIASGVLPLSVGCFLSANGLFLRAESGGSPEKIVLSISRFCGCPCLGVCWVVLGCFFTRPFFRSRCCVFVYSILFGALGVSYFFGLAIIAGLARFLPYIGPFIAWTTYGLVAYFQGTTIFGFSPLGYAVLVIGTAWLTDVIIDNFVSTRVMADALAVHPAAILVAALVGANLMGITGMILAAPVLATIQLFFRYIIRKLIDSNPWEGIDFINQKK